MVSTYLNGIMDSMRTVICAIGNCFALEACWEVKLCSDGRESLLITLDCRRRRNPGNRFQIVGSNWNRSKGPRSRFLVVGRIWKRRNPENRFLRRRGIHNVDWLA